LINETHKEMKTIQITGAKHFLNKLTANRLTDKQTNRAVAYLRAKGQAFYDDWSREHCLIIDSLNKSIVIESLKRAF
jgi:hypothetical protein